MTLRIGGRNIISATCGSKKMVENKMKRWHEVLGLATKNYEITFAPFDLWVEKYDLNYYAEMVNRRSAKHCIRPDAADRAKALTVPELT